jgi:hypothetical protein
LALVLLHLFVEFLHDQREIVPDVRGARRIIKPPTIVDGMTSTRIAVRTPNASVRSAARSARRSRR